MENAVIYITAALLYAAGVVLAIWAIAGCARLALESYALLKTKWVCTKIGERRVLWVINHVGKIDKMMEEENGK